MQRITIREIKKHPWFLKNLAEESGGGAEQNYEENEKACQSIEEVISIIEEARKPGEGPKFGGVLIGESMDLLDDLDADADIDDIEASGDFVCAL